MNDRLVPGLRHRTRSHQLWTLVIELFQLWEERMNSAAASAGLSPVSVWALVQLDPDKPMSQKQLAARLRCNPSTVVDPTDRLESAGLVLRKTSSTDRRVNVLTVTAKGKRIRNDLIERLFEPPAAFRQMTAREQTRFRDVMLAVVATPPRP